ncbi:MAG: hypothetical protein D3916_05510 [Candidatus Electrothrix sp. MAN1_4]|nr:hypothetical protein [Candidatus Electrothrix sp. MAN1_4]
MRFPGYAGAKNYIMIDCSVNKKCYSRREITGGFTEEVLEYVSSREDMYASDYDGIDNIFRRFGSNYSIPMFTGSDAFRL